MDEAAKVRNTIDKCRRSDSTQLELSGCNLTEIPGEVFELLTLTELILSYNKITIIPPEVAKLQNLQSLDLFSNQITTIPPEIAKLQNLQSLILFGNQITTIPTEIAKLQNLQSLDLSSNQITTIPPEIARLQNLQSLYLSSNQITTIPPEIAKLQNLQSLYLSYNQITTIPSEIAKLQNLQSLDLSSNQLSKLSTALLQLKLPIYWMDYIEIGQDCTQYILIEDNPLQVPPLEIARQGDQAIRNFLSLSTETIQLYEAKLILVGEGGAGKSCLMKRILNPGQKIDKNERSTEGIAITKWEIPMQNGKKFTTNFWDFGGQEIYHATHQFFLTKRSLYLLVWDARKDDDLAAFDYWLNVIKLLSDNAPVLIVLNKIDARIKDIDEKSLKEKFPNILEFHKVSALAGKGMEQLVQSIKHHIARLEHIGTSLPKAWVTMKKFFTEWQKKYNYITYTDYEYLCAKFNLDQEQARFLSRYFHDLGFFLHFHDNPILKDIIFLKPDWATSAVYLLSDTKQIIEKRGFLPLSSWRTSGKTTLRTNTSTSWN